MTTKTVVVVGGGYGGITVARALDDVANVVLVEPKDTFVHNVGSLRALVDGDWVERIFLPYDSLLTRGRVVHSAAVAVDSKNVTTASGERIDADYIVLATGSTYPFPAKPDLTDSGAAKAKLRATTATLEDANSVLILGAGPAGIELAGEIATRWPDKSVTIVDRGETILAGGLPEELRTEIRNQLDGLGVTLVLGTSLSEQPPSEPGEAKTFTVSTLSGVDVEADIWFRCYGVVPVSDYLTDTLASARQDDGHLSVTEHLRVEGSETVFAIGDVTAVPEAKMAKAAEQHADVVAVNLRSLIAGVGDLQTYASGEATISLPLGPSGGASYAPGPGVLGAEVTAKIKGADLRIDGYLELLNIER